MKLIKNIFLSTMVLLVSLTTYAQEEEAPEPTFAISGSIDTYYRS